MDADLDAARTFCAAAARPLDRARLALIFDDDPDPDAALAALAAHEVPGGGYGGALEPDLRSAEAQPAAAIHAFEVFEEIAPHTDPAAAGLCDWLARIQLPDGGLPFALPITDPTGCAPFWVEADPRVSSLQITAAVAAGAQRVARTDMAVATHPWTALSTGHCLAAMERTSGPMPALALMFSLRLLSAIEPLFPRAAAQLERLGAQLPPSGRLPVEGGSEHEFMRPLDFAPRPEDAARTFIRSTAIEADLERLAAGQDRDGGWRADWISYSPEAAREWRGHLTVRAVAILRANGRL